MLTGLFILTAAAIILILLNWSAKNDSVPNNGKTSGFFAIKDMSETDANDEGESDRRETPVNSDEFPPKNTHS